MALQIRPSAVAAGFLGGLLVVGGLLWFLGVDSVLEALRSATPWVLPVILGVAVVWLAAWSMALRTVLDVLGTSVGVVTAVGVYAAAIFANNVTPFGQAGGEPLSAYFISDATRSEYETAFAAVASVDALHFVPSLGLGLVGLGYFGATVTLGRRLEIAAAAVVGTVVVAVGGGYLAWTNRYRLEEATVAVVTPAFRTVVDVIPRVEPPTEESVRARIEGFYDGIERVATDRTGLALVLGFSALGWLALTVSLWLSLYALGHTVPYAAVLVAIPVGGFAAVAPLPGGLGGVETLLVALLVAVTPVGADLVAAAVLLHRAAVFWLPTVVGGGAAAAITAH